MQESLAEETVDLIMEDCPAILNHYPEDCKLIKMTTNQRKGLEIWHLLVDKINPNYVFDRNDEDSTSIR